jgi:UDP-glucuronate decarboxylase
MRPALRMSLVSPILVSAMDSVLITGGAGFIGTHLATMLARQGAGVTVVDNFSRAQVDGKALASLGIQVVEHDLTEPLDKVLANDVFQHVVHLAAVVGVGQVMREPQKVVRTNVLTMINVLEHCARAVPESFLLSSTSETSDGAVALGVAEPPVTEEIPFVSVRPHDPRSSYGLSKIVCEGLVRAAGEALGMHVKVARYFNIYGPRMGASHVIPQLMLRLMRDPTTLSVYGAQHKRAFCFIDDAVSVTLRLMEDPGPWLVANVGNDGEEVTMLNLARCIADIAELNPRIITEEAPEGSPFRRIPDLSIQRERLNYEPRVNLATGLRQTWAWYSDHAERFAGLTLVP